MKAVFKISAKAALDFARSAAAADFSASFGAHAFDFLRRNLGCSECNRGTCDCYEQSNGLALGWSTCGGSQYWICRNPDQGGWLLVFDGSRRSFENGAMPFCIVKDDEQIFLSAGQEHGIELLYWSSSVPGNPDPFEDWEAILAAEAELNAPPTLGEEIQLQMEAA